MKDLYSGRWCVLQFVKDKGVFCPDVRVAVPAKTEQHYIFAEWKGLDTYHYCPPPPNPNCPLDNAITQSIGGFLFLYDVSIHKGKTGHSGCGRTIIALSFNLHLPTYCF